MTYIRKQGISQASDASRLTPTQHALEQHPASPGLKRTGETNRTSRHPKAIGGHQGGTEKNGVKEGHITASSPERFRLVNQALRHRGDLRALSDRTKNKTSPEPSHHTVMGLPAQESKFRHTRSTVTTTGV